MGGAGGVAPCTDPGVLPIEMTPPAVLSATGLYDDISQDSIAAHARPFAPQYELWSDGAGKRRWIYLPPGCPIDTSDMDSWVLPVGTRLWKEFSVGATRIETRLIHRYGEGPSDFWYASYAWDAGLTEAQHVPVGVPDAMGTTHDIPGEGQCFQCHAGSPAVALGF